MPASPKTAPQRKRQWGAERSTEPLPTIHVRPSDRQIALARLAIVFTVIFWFLYVLTTIIYQFLENGTESFRFTIEAISYLIVVTFLSFSALMYLVARQGALIRFRDHVRVPRAELDRHFGQNHSSMTVLVPSYSEEPQVIRGTLWSAALQEYPEMRVVLLVDDPPFPTDPETAARLERARGMADEITDALAEPRGRFSTARMNFEFDSVADSVPTIETVRQLAYQYFWAADWLETMAENETIDDHVDEFFADQVLRGLSNELALVGTALTAAADQGETPTHERLAELYRRLDWTFAADLTTFERKKYASLSHETNKAMNLNSYIGLMGGTYDTEETAAGLVLRPTTGPGDFTVPDSEYLLTLDADSVLLRDYCLRLVYFLEQPENERVAVTQTPYSSFRGAGTRIERLAGGSTDIQHLLHQGMSYYNAAFWVGANAVIRKRALEDIVEVETVGGFDVKRYVQDRTVIEDTESSVDLGTHRWSIVNYPERLSYSATPPDFGSLVVQRRRWANGGLLIMPKFLRQVRDRRARGERVTFTEFALRANYMSSIAWASFGLVFLLAYPYDSRLLSPLVLLTAAPYFLAMGFDLRNAGYKFSDIGRIYGFNLILLPVNLAGVFKSLEQAITVKKIPFSRTPKVKNRTAAPFLYVVSPYVIVIFSVVTFVRDMSVGNWGNAAFAAFNALLAGGAIVAYIGVKNSIVDIWLALTGWLFVDVKSKSTTDDDTPDRDTPIDWRSVLYRGDSDGRGSTSISGKVTPASDSKQAA
ncbi:cellulose synthase/poly-beta-1,6-N-acetylglucosamine synthase-like glycosyltransferase [Conyzicola lurida]|uniref:Cellulose synthase/poly-beta-1,6-N-acetylglucosamine synthase-like glycosyltransferase n=1 Tax=Conyzicola lurida TaxID=1172621 RepID=A0A841AT39_9MICO|nr:glycosyltransferase family 2 protein [Conyzicola lurida]MBB5844846.1 cellulose synthase/poly-beta-1,6-N-acetylglucosamine synthase-like glycosyltransferase [Conyzicola lurida]